MPVYNFVRLCKAGVMGTVEERPEFRTEMVHIYILAGRDGNRSFIALNRALPGMFPSKQ